MVFDCCVCCGWAILVACIRLVLLAVGFVGFGLMRFLVWEFGCFVVVGCCIVVCCCLLVWGWVLCACGLGGLYAIGMRVEAFG